MSCSLNQRLSAYRDGELDTAAAEQVAAHIAACPECARELAGMTALSRLFEQSRPPHISQIAMYRLHNNLDMVVRGNFLRTVKIVRAVAACMLLVGSLWLIQSDYRTPGAAETSFADTVEPIPPQLDAAVMATAETQSLEATTPAAVWYVADFSSRSDDSQ